LRARVEKGGTKKLVFGEGTTSIKGEAQVVANGMTKPAIERLG